MKRVVALKTHIYKKMMGDSVQRVGLLKKLDMNEVCFDIAFFLFTSYLLTLKLIQGRDLVHHISYPGAIMLIFAINCSVMRNMAGVLAAYRSCAGIRVRALVMVVFGFTALMIDLYLPYVLRVCGIISSDLKYIGAYGVAMFALLVGAYWGEYVLRKYPDALKPSQGWLNKMAPKLPLLFIAMIPIVYALVAAAIAVWYVKLHVLTALIVSSGIFLGGSAGLIGLYKMSYGVLTRRPSKGIHGAGDGRRRWTRIVSDGLLYIFMAVLISVLSEIYVHSYVFIAEKNSYAPSIYRLFFILFATGLLPYRIIILFEPPVSVINFFIGIAVFSLFIFSACQALG